MEKINEEILKAARSQFALQGYKAMAKKYNEKQRRAWRLKGAEATRKRWKKAK